MRQGTEGGQEELRIPKPVYEQLIRHCLEKWPKEEACGFLIANAGGWIERVYPMTNVEHNPIGYSMDPREQLRVEKELRQRSQRVVGIYHSHTATEARPSTVDTSNAISPDISYIIVSLKNPQAPDVKSYRIDGTVVIPEQIVPVN